MARMTLEEIRNRASTVDRAKVEATTEAEIEAHRAADGDTDLDATADAYVVEPPRALRVRLGMTQPEMAAALSIPLGTWRNWEQGRVKLEPAAMALLRVVSHSPAVALAALSTIKESSRFDPVERYREAISEMPIRAYGSPMQDVVVTNLLVKGRATGPYHTGRKSAFQRGMPRLKPA